MYYHSALSKFLGIDLLADWFTDHSPYHFGYNNPISFADPTGLAYIGGIVLGYNGKWMMWLGNNEYDNMDLIMMNVTVIDKAPNEPHVTREFGINPHQYGNPGGGPGGGGPSGGNPSPRGATNGWIYDFWFNNSAVTGYNSGQYGAATQMVLDFQ